MSQCIRTSGKKLMKNDRDCANYTFKCNLLVRIKMFSMKLSLLDVRRYVFHFFHVISTIADPKVFAKTILALAFVIFDGKVHAQQKRDLYRVSVDLLHIKNEQINISFSPPKNNLDKGVFILPKLIPGYYGAMNFGQYVSSLQAFDARGSIKSVRRIDVNSWLIEDLKNVIKVNYKVSPSWKCMTERTSGAKSAGSHFIKDSVFVINYNSLMGYFEEFSGAAYYVEVIKNKGFYASSALSYHKKNDSTDFMRAKSYRHLVDAPVMYCIPDTTSIRLGGTEVLVSFYSKNSRTYSPVLAAKLKGILNNQKAYLGGKLPVSKYAFLIYHENFPGSGLIGD